MARIINLEFKAMYNLFEGILKKAEVARKLCFFDDAANLIARLDRLYNEYESFLYCSNPNEDRLEIINNARESMRKIFESTTYVGTIYGMNK